MMTILAIDYGSKKIGFAVGQTITATANPLDVIVQNGDMWKKIDKIFANWRPSTIVVGQPKLADGKLHPLEKNIESFIVALKKRYNVGYVYRQDEALTSYEAGADYKMKNGKWVDAHAAALILESWMRGNIL